MIKEVIVVEGRDDTVAIRRAVEADTIETGGSAINDRILSRIALAQERRGVIVLTDPDHAGERIRKIIANKVLRLQACVHSGSGCYPQGRYWRGECFAGGDPSGVVPRSYIV